MSQDKFNLFKLGEYYNTYKPLEQEVGDFLRSVYPSESLRKKYSNALRHQYASAIFAQQYSPDVARILGNINEWPIVGGGSGNGDTEIDQTNNEIGRNYGVKYPNYTRNQFLKKMLEDYDKNAKYVGLRRNK